MLVYSRKPTCSKFAAVEQLAVSRPDTLGSRSNRAIHYELVQKAARARISIALSKFRPTAVAVDLAGRLNMTMASASGPSGFYEYCGA